MDGLNVRRKRILSGFDGDTCKVDPKLMYDGHTAILSYTTLLLSGSDVFYDTYVVSSTDHGRTFSEPHKLINLDTIENGIRKHFTLTSMFYNHKYQKWILFGKESLYANDNVPLLDENGVAEGKAVFAYFDPQTCDMILPTEAMPMPFECRTACPFGQIIELENGDMLLTFYLTKGASKTGFVTIQYALTENGLRIVNAGTPYFGEEYKRGFGEPSLAKLNDKYYMTLRTDEIGLFAESEDGFTFSKPKPWTWEDGTPIGNANTMQRWVRFADRLYLVYTRVDRLNGHVFRNRAPLYMTRFDEKKGCLVRAEEQILVPELGARLGNFHVLDLNEREAVVSTAEWMQPKGCEAYGSDNSLWLCWVKDGAPGRNRK